MAFAILSVKIILSQLTDCSLCVGFCHESDHSGPSVLHLGILDLSAVGEPLPEDLPVAVWGQVADCDGVRAGHAPSTTTAHPLVTAPVSALGTTAHIVATCRVRCKRWITLLKVACKIAPLIHLSPINYTQPPL